MGAISDRALRDIETIATEVDQLAEVAADDQARGHLSARRQRLLIELDVAGALAADNALHSRLREISPVLADYATAATAMRAYLASPDRARLFADPPPANLLECNVSLDWFRKPSGYIPEGVPGDGWLALCERNFIDPYPASGGECFMRLQNAIHKLMYRIEVGPKPRLWRVLPA